MTAEAATKSSKRWTADEQQELAQLEAGLGTMSASDFIDHLAAHSTRSRDAIKKRRQRRSYVPTVSRLRAAEPAAPNILPCEDQGPTNFSVEENEELVEAIESLSLNEEDARIRREILASPERGKDALAEWIMIIGMSCPPPNMTAATNEFCRIFDESSINDDLPIANRREESIKVMQAISAEDVRWAMKSMKSDTPGLDNITVRALRKVSPNRLCLLFNAMLYLEHMPKSLKIGKTVFIRKAMTGGSDGVTKWRPITTSSIFMRALHKILARRLEALSLHSHNQRGFSRIDGVFSNVFCLEQIVKHATLNGRPLCLVSVDISKAFDTVSHHNGLRAANPPSAHSHNSIIYGPVREGVLGIFGFRDRKPAIVMERVEKLRSSDSTFAAIMGVCGQCIQRVRSMVTHGSKQAYHEHHAVSLNGSFSGCGGLRQLSAKLHSNRWVYQPPMHWSGEDYIKAVHLSFNLLPCRGENCQRQETVCHVLQACLKTRVHWEGQEPLSSFHNEKVCHYSSDAFLAKLMELYPGKSIAIVPIIVGARVAWCAQNDALTAAIRIGPRAVENIITGVIRGGVIIHSTFMRRVWEPYLRSKATATQVHAEIRS
uniref:Reverse transcriptase domain-containing protein n=1 Tax=Glossina austeni TaxID=7395 RepID=A0A1A9UYI9_GLOAU